MYVSYNDSTNGSLNFFYFNQQSLKFWWFWFPSSIRIWISNTSAVRVKISVICCDRYNKVFHILLNQKELNLGLSLIRRFFSLNYSKEKQHVVQKKLKNVVVNRHEKSRMFYITFFFIKYQMLLDFYTPSQWFSGLASLFPRTTNPIGS